MPILKHHLHHGLYHKLISTLAVSNIDLDPSNMCSISLSCKFYPSTHHCSSTCHKVKNKAFRSVVKTQPPPPELI